MLRAQIHAPGVVRLDDVEDPRPGARDAVIEVGACGMNNTDVNTRVGWYSKSVTAATGSSGFDVEVDGDAYHEKRTSADAARERKLVRAGYTVVRVPASLVERDLSRAVEIVRVALGRAMVN